MLCRCVGGRFSSSWGCQELAELLAKRIPALLRRRGLDTPQRGAEESDRLARDQPWLSEVYAASVCGRVATGPKAGRRVAVGGEHVDPEGIDNSGIAFENPTKASVDQAIRVRRSSAPVFRA